MIDLDKILKVKTHPRSEAYKSLSYDWKAIWKIPEFAVLESIEQNPKWHNEGNVKKHTLLVCKQAIKEVNEFASIEDREFEIYNIAKNFDEYETCYLEPCTFYKAKLLLASALFHDIGKAITTSKGKDGNWHAYNHEYEGERLTRYLLWNENVNLREDICALVKYHMLPLNVFERKNYLEEIIKVSYNIPSWELLLLLKKCDITGSIQSNTVSKEKDFIVLKELEMICKQLGCYGYNKIEMHFFSNRIKDSIKFEYEKTKKPLKVIVMIGLPGSGKDTFINNNLIRDKKDDKDFLYLCNISRNNNGNITGIHRYTKDEVCVICRDDIRAELGYCKAGEKVVLDRKKEDKVSEVATEKMYEAAEEGKVIILNNINLKKEYRVEYARLLSNYDTEITYIYVEASSLDKNIERRDGEISENVFASMIKKFEWPNYEEYDNFYYIKT